MRRIIGPAGAKDAKRWRVALNGKRPGVVWVWRRNNQKIRQSTRRRENAAEDKTAKKAAEKDTAASSKKDDDKRTEKLTEKLASSFPATVSDTAKPSTGTSVEDDADVDYHPRPAGPARDRIAANDDLPSIGGLIYALQQRPSRAPFYFAFGASVIWVFYVPWRCTVPV